MKKELAKKLIQDGLWEEYTPGMQLQDVLEKNLQPALQAIAVADSEKPWAAWMQENNDIIEKDTRGFPLWYTHEDIESRNERIIDLQTAGLTAKTIVKFINDSAKQNNRPTVKDTRAVITIISEYYRRLKPSQKDAKSETEALKDAALMRQEQMIETLSLYISNNKNILKPWEYVQATAELFKMQQFNIENRNWNASRANPNLAINAGTVNIFNNAVLDNSSNSAIWEVIDILDAELS